MKKNIILFILVISSFMSFGQVYDDFMRESDMAYYDKHMNTFFEFYHDDKEFLLSYDSTIRRIDYGIWERDLHLYYRDSIDTNGKWLQATDKPIETYYQKIFGNYKTDTTFLYEYIPITYLYYEGKGQYGHQINKLNDGIIEITIAIFTQREINDRNGTETWDTQYTTIVYDEYNQDILFMPNGDGSYSVFNGKKSLRYSRTKKYVYKKK